jgi:hypothetical protein
MLKLCETDNFYGTFDGETLPMELKPFDFVTSFELCCQRDRWLLYRSDRHSFG